MSIRDWPRPIRRAAAPSCLLALLLSPSASAQFGMERMLHTTVSNTFAVRAADLDQDGDLDVLVGHSNRVDWIENQGAGSFGPPQVVFSIPFFNSPIAIEVGDLDLDGSLDIVVLRSGPGDVRWYRNPGDGAFGAHATIDSFGNNGTGLSLADVDGDGDLDVVTEADSLDEVRLYENLGGGTFGPRVVITNQADRVIDVAPADMDGDGDVDLLAVCSGDDELILLLNDGTGSFGPEVVLASIPSDPTGVKAADVDGDGDLDAVVARYWFFNGQGDVRWHENLGGGSFGPESIIGTFGTIRRETFEIADYNGDGTMDVLVGLGGSSSVGRLRLFANQGGGMFGSPAEAILSEPVTAIDLGDLDGDGDLDITSGHFSSARWTENVAFQNDRYCGPGVANSTGFPATMLVTGSMRVADNALTLRANGLPPMATAIFITSRTQGFLMTPGQSQGNLCLAGSIGRYSRPGEILTASSAGLITLPIDLTRMPTSSAFVPAQVGETWNFQAWHRDVNPGATSNLSDGLSVTLR